MTEKNASSLTDQLPLKGLKILSVEQYGAGPFCTQYLATFGADVIKIENKRLGGDVSRVTGPFKLGDEDSLYFQSFNQNKKSLSLDLKAAAGQEVLHRLVKQVDVVANNARGDQPQKLGITYEQLKAVNSKIVCAHLNAYGRGTTRESWPGYDYLMQAECGFMDLTGEPSGIPQRAGLSVIDFMTGMNQLFAIMAGVFKARETGVGSEYDVCLFDTALFQLTYPALWHMNEDFDLTRQPRSAHPDATPSQMVQTQDGWIFVMLQIEKFWNLFSKLVPTPGLTDNPEYATVEGRRANRDRITQQMDELFLTKTTAQWLEILEGHVPVAPIKNMADALASPFPAETGMIQGIDHPARPDLQVLSNPIQMNGRRLPTKPAPQSIGQHTDEVLSEYGFSAEEIETLTRDGVV